MDYGRQPRLCDTPNVYAREPSLEILTGGLIVHGYQEFILTHDVVKPLGIDAPLQRKYELLRPYFEPRFIAHKTVLDVGANGGFFSFLAAQNSAKQVFALDIDDTYWLMMRQAQAHVGLPQIESVATNISKWETPGDVVIALAIVHWIYSCTAVLGSIDAVVQKLATLTRDFAIIEWVAETDPAIQFFGHTKWNGEFVSGPYDVDGFECALAAHFHHYACVGDVTPTRHLYVAFKRERLVDLSTPLPLMAPAESLISCRLLSQFRWTDYWSIVYDVNGVILKQASYGLAMREASFLRRLQSLHFPSLMDCGQAEGYSWLSMEKVEGKTLDFGVAEGLASADALATFALHCAGILEELAAQGISHNDIRPANIIVRDSLPVLIDFGWASAPGLPLPWLPAELGGSSRCPDGTLSDVYAMGRVLANLIGSRSSWLATIAGLMAAESIDLRITNIHVIKALLTVAMDLESTPGLDDGSLRLAATQLLDQVSLRDARITDLEERLHQLATELEMVSLQRSQAADDLAAAVVAARDAEQELDAIRNTRSWRMTAFLRGCWLCIAKLWRS